MVKKAKLIFLVQDLLVNIVHESNTTSYVVYPVENSTACSCNKKDKEEVCEGVYKLWVIHVTEILEEGFDVHG